MLYRKLLLISMLLWPASGFTEALIYQITRTTSPPDQSNCMPPLYSTMSMGGTGVVFSASEDYTGGNPDELCQFFMLDESKSDIQQVSSFIPQAQSYIPPTAPYGVNLSADGDYILYQVYFTAGLYTMSSSGSDNQRIFPDYSDRYLTKTLSPDGSVIYFSPNDASFFDSSIQEYNTAIFSVNRDGSSLKKIIDIPDTEVSQLKFSGDGTKLGFITNADLMSTDIMSNTLYIMNTDGTGLIQITDDTYGKVSLLDFSGGNTLAFASEKGIYVSDINGNNIRLIYDSAISVGRIALSANGSTLAAYIGETLPDTTSSGFYEGIVIFDVTTGSTIYKTDVDSMSDSALYANILYPLQISDNGNFIYFYSIADLTGDNPEGIAELFVLTLDGTQPVSTITYPLTAQTSTDSESGNVNDSSGSDDSSSSLNDTSTDINTDDQNNDTTQSNSTSAGGTLGLHFSLLLLLLYISRYRHRC